MHEIDESIEVRRFRFDISPSSSSSSEPDSPSRMLPSPVPIHRGLDELTPKDIDDIFHEVRQHDGCYRAASLLQSLFDLYPPNHPLLIRTAKGTTATTSTSRWLVFEWKTHNPKTITASTVFHPESQLYTTGARNLENHSTLTFGTDEGIDFTLDLSSMQFGPNGRGQGGEPFWLGTTRDWHGELMKRVCGRAENFRGAGSVRVAETGDLKDRAFQRRVVEKVKKRLDEGLEKDRWCDTCGKPDATKRCACGEVKYCSGEHQVQGWGFHKKFCTAKGKGKK